MRLHLVRHATPLLQLAGRCVLVDPMLDPAGARPPVEGTPNPRPNPLCELPEPPEVLVRRLDGVLVTHLHSDHLDATAVALLDERVPVFCQPADAAALRERGFADVRPVETDIAWDGVRILRTGGRHGAGALGKRLGPVSGFVLRAPGEPVLYVAGDTIWCEEVRAAVEAHVPDAVVVNAGAATFLEGGRAVMDADDVVAVARHARRARVVAVHLEAMNHCVLTRADLVQRLHDEGLTRRVTVPEDGAEVPLP